MRAAWSIFAERTTKPFCFSARRATFGSVMARQQAWLPASLNE